MITKQQALDALAEVVAEMGEGYVYSRADGEEVHQFGCQYAINGEPSCIAGRAIFKLDPELFEKFAQYEVDEEESFPICDVNENLDDVGIEPDALRVFQEAQEQQDCLETYGFALDAARAVV